MDCKSNSFIVKGGLILIDKNTFCEHIRLHERAMYYLAFSIVRNESDAGEVISESIYRAYKNLNTLKNENSFKPWILRIIHNTAVEMIRKNSKIIPMDEMRDIGNNGKENEISTKLDLRNAVESLKPPYRVVVLLFYYENLPVSKIAQITNTNAVSVKKQLSRARNMLRERLKEDWDL